MNFKRKKISAYNKSGFSLIEVLVSVALFVGIILTATEVFVLVINGQRNAIAGQNVQESLKYFFEVTAKEMRMARRNDGSCPGTAGKIYSVTSNSYGDVLSFQNYYKQCVSYRINLDETIQRFEISRDGVAGYITPKSIEVKNLKFVANEVGLSQPTITIAIKGNSLASTKYTTELNVQTTITSRYYK